MGGALYGPFQSYNDPNSEYSAYTGMFGIYLSPPMTDYDASMRIFPASFPDRTVFSWRVQEGLPSRINGFLHVDDGNYDESPGTLSGGPRQVYTLTALKYDMAWTFSGDVRSGLLFDSWLTATAHPTGILTDKVCAVGMLPKLSTSAITYVAGLPAVGSGTFTDAGGVQWSAKQGVTGTGEPNYLFYRPGNLDYEGEFDLVGAYAFLIAAGKITGNEYFNGATLGVEPNAGSGIFTVDQFERTALAGAARVPWDIATLVSNAISASSTQLVFQDAAGATSHQYRINGGTAQTLAGNKQIGSGITNGDTIEVRGVNSTGNGNWKSVAFAYTAPNVLAGGTWLVGALAQGMSNSGGLLTCLNTPNIYSDFTMSGRTFTAGKYYEVAFTMSGYAAGSVRPELRGGTQRNGTVRSANGVYTERLLANTGNNIFAMLLTGDPGVNTWSVNNNMTVTGPYDTATVGGA